MLKKIKRLIAGLSSALGFVPALAAAKSPTVQIQPTIQQVRNVVASPNRNDQARFDWLEMSKQALGTHW